MSTETTILDAVRQAGAEAGGGGGRIVLAVSGGLDSMSLLDAANRVVAADRIVVATFDHGTGEPARAAASLVCARAAELGLACESGRASRSLRSEAELRDARWAFLHDVAKRHDGVVATAHTADDHVETVLMRVLRGAGARGLAGLHAPGGPLRPFLEISRAELEAYARARDLRWVEDPSNASPIFFRNRVRRELLPALRAARPGLPGELLRISREAAAWRQDVDAFIAAHILVRTSARSRSFAVILAPLTGMSSAELSVLWPSIGAKFGLMLDRRGISRLVDFTLDARVGSRIQLSGGWSVIRSRDDLAFSASSQVAPASVTIDLSARTVWGAWTFRRRSASDADAQWSSPLPADAVLTVRAWEPGDKMRSARGSFRKVKQLLSRAGVTGHKRAGWPVVLAGDEIVWIPGVRRSKITERLGTAGVPFICEFIDR
jgi:tRNA(Ile)-lysidine synthase